MTPCLASRVPSTLRDADSSASHLAHFPGERHHQTQAVMFLPGQNPVLPLKWSLQSHIPLGFGCTTLPCGVRLIRQRTLLDFWAVSYCECSIRRQVFLTLIPTYIFQCMCVYVYVCTQVCHGACGRQRTTSRSQQFFPSIKSLSRM